MCLTISQSYVHYAMSTSNYYKHVAKFITRRNRTVLEHPPPKLHKYVARLKIKCTGF